MKKKTIHEARAEFLKKLFRLGLRKGKSPQQVMLEFCPETERTKKIFEILKQKLSRSRIT